MKSEMKLNNRVLVTGGAGYIGSHAVEQLVDAGASVFIIDNFSTGFSRLVHPGATLILGDVHDSDLVHRSLKQHKIDSVIHFAAFTSVAESVTNPEKYYDNNLGGTIGLLKGIRGTPVKNFVFSSTAAVYADPGKEPVHENSPTDPPTAYGRSKLMSERVIQDFAAATGMNYMILRYFNVAGATATGRCGQIGDEHTVLIKRAALAAVGKIPKLQIFGTDYQTLDGTAVRDFIHVVDLANIHLKAIQRLDQGMKSTIMNCGYGSGYTVKQIIDTMRLVSGVHFQALEQGRRPGDLAQVIAKVDKLKTEFDWHPSHNNINEICKSAYQWELQELSTGKSR